MRAGSLRSVVSAVAACVLLVGTSQVEAAVIKLDGVLDGSPPYSSSEVVTWFNGHQTSNSIYGDNTDTTTIHYGVAENADGPVGTDYFFLYVEVPLFAKNMIWDDDIGDEFPVSNTDPTSGLTEADVSPYRAHHETHHDPGDLKLNFKTATGSEKLLFNDEDGKDVFKADFDGNADDDFGLVGFKDSVDFLVHDNAICTTLRCLERTTTMSFEFQFELNQTVNNQLLDHVRNGIEFHLSPERRGEIEPPPGPVPGPGSLPLLVIGLGALLAASRHAETSGPGSTDRRPGTTDTARS